MDEQSKKKLDEITSKEIAALTKDDIAFLNARRSYLRPEQVEVYRPVLKIVEPKAPEDAEDVFTPINKRK